MDGRMNGWTEGDTERERQRESKADSQTCQFNRRISYAQLCRAKGQHCQQKI